MGILPGVVYRLDFDIRHYQIHNMDHRACARRSEPKLRTEEPVAKRKRIAGRIITVQEERFRMVDETGRSYLLDLAHDARVTPDELKAWNDARTQIVVEYEGEPETDSGVARSVTAA